MIHSSSKARPWAQESPQYFIPAIIIAIYTSLVYYKELETRKSRAPQLAYCRPRTVDGMVLVQVQGSETQESLRYKL